MTDLPHRTTLGDLVAATGMFSGDTAIMIERFEGSNVRADVSFVIPIYNQTQILERNLTSIANCSVLPAEYILVLDACTDESERIARRWAQNLLASRTNTALITLATCSTEVFETNCDNVGSSLARAKCIIEIQSDMLIDHVGFDADLVDALGRRPDLLAVSGRGAHPWSDAVGCAQDRFRRYEARMTSMIWQKASRRSIRKHSYRPSALTFSLTGRAGRLNELIDLPLERTAGSGVLFLGETVMRGPLALDAAKFKHLGGFDGSRFFLGNDDHDLMARAWASERWRGGYLPIAFSSPLSEGATRQEKTPLQKSRFKQLSTYYAEQYSSSALARAVTGAAPRPPREVLELPGRPSTRLQHGQAGEFSSGYEHRLSGE